MGSENLQKLAFATYSHVIDPTAAIRVHQEGLDTGAFRRLRRSISINSVKMQKDESAVIAYTNGSSRRLTVTAADAKYTRHIHADNEDSCVVAAIDHETWANVAKKPIGQEKKLSDQAMNK